MAESHVTAASSVDETSDALCTDPTIGAITLKESAELKEGHSDRGFDSSSTTLDTLPSISVNGMENSATRTEALRDQVSKIKPTPVSSNNLAKVSHTVDVMGESQPKIESEFVRGTELNCRQEEKQWVNSAQRNDRFTLNVNCGEQIPKNKVSSNGTVTRETVGESKDHAMTTWKDSTAPDQKNGYYVNQAFEGDVGVKSGAAEEGSGEPQDMRALRRRIVRNVLVLSAAFLLHFTAYFGSANLQSSVNAEEGLGTDSLLTVYAALIVSSFFLPATVIRRLGCKWTLVLSMAVYTPYLAAQFAASRWTLLPAAVLVGLGGGPLWCAKCSYLTAAAREYARRATPPLLDEDVQVRFFGVFFTLFPLSNVFGNIISSAVLTSGDEADAVASGVLCGADFCPAEHDAGVNPNLRRPPLAQLYTLNGVFLACMAAAALAVALLLDPVDSSAEDEDNSAEASGLRLLTASARLLADPLHLLVTPIAVFFGVSQGFLGADFTQAYVSCSWGIPHIGFVLMCYGAVNCAFSAAVSWLSKSVGRLSVVSAYIVSYCVVISVLFVWRPDPTVSTAPYYLFVSFWGAADSTFLVINALYGILFRGDEKAAYSNFRVWESAGFIASYSYSPVLCTHYKLALMAGLLSIAAVCYWSAEWLARRRAASNFWLHEPATNKNPAI